jgi:hypothetical protein
LYQNYEQDFLLIGIQDGQTDNCGT